jgi:N-acetylneuraminic acid mutarotase
MNARGRSIRAVLACCGLAMVLSTMGLAASPATVPAQAATSYTWVRAGRLSTARTAQAIRLRNGRVLVVGGLTSTGTLLATTDLYRPSSNSWSRAASLPQPRFGFALTLLRNGKVLLAGGTTCKQFTCEERADALLYNPARNAWSPAASMPTARVGHTATRLANGQVLVVGGVTDPDGLTATASTALYDPRANRWRAAASMSTGRLGHSATLLHGGRVLAAGGLEDTLTASSLATAELYNPTTNRWTRTGSMATPRADHTASLLRSGKVLVAAGFQAAGVNLTATAELYDPTRRVWTRVPSLAHARTDHVAAVLADGRVLIAGGRQETAPFTLASVELYDPRANRWSRAASLLTPRQSPAIARLTNGDILVAGGRRLSAQQESSDLASAERFVRTARRITHAST